MLSFLKHENFNETTRRNDIALIILNKEAILNDFNKIVCLPNRLVHPSMDNQVYAFNWNDLFKLSTNTDVKLTLLNYTYCNGYDVCNNCSQICAGKLNCVLFLFCYLN